MEKLNIFDKKSLSLWLKDGISSNIPKLEEDIICDVCVVGAGITGITTAYRLNESGLKVVLIDKQEPINLASGNTTAKFTFQHYLIYSEILKNYDLDKAKLYYEAQLDGLNFVRLLIDKHNISCDFKETSSIIYAENEKQFEKILDEKSAYEQLNIPCEIIYDLPLNIEGIGGLKVDSQFELNPVKYLDFLISYLLKNDVSIFKNTEAKTIVSEGEAIKVVTGDQKVIKCKNLVISTAYPFFGANGFYYTRLEALRSYLLAFVIKEPLDDNYMMISTSDSPYSLRFSNTDGIKYLLVGGQGHKVGQANSEIESYNQLMNFARTNFKVNYPAFRWSAQDYKSIDNIPYIGNLTSSDNNIFVATGFNKWGMSNGSFSSMLITDLINGNKSKYEELFNPSRGEVKDNMGSFIKANFNVAKELIKGKLLPDEIDLEDIKNDEGGIIKYDGKRVAAYRDASGELFLSDSTCTHLGCELEYNNAERSFDCPCHGSRFNYDGKVIEGVANADLKRIKMVTTT